MDAPMIPSEESQSQDMNIAEIIYVIGGPGVGKGTNCSRLARDLNVAHISVGDLLREEQVRPESSWRSTIEEHKRDGTLVPTELTVELLLKRILQEMRANTTRFLIDGFPRTTEQASLFKDKVSKICTSKGVISLHCSEREMLSRVLGRGKTSGRIDDNEATFRKRFQRFTEDSIPVLDYFRGKGKMIEMHSELPRDEIYDVFKREARDLWARRL